MNFEVISVIGNSVRIKSGMFIADIKVISVNGGKRVLLPYGMYADDFRILVGVVLTAFENSQNEGEIVNDNIKRFRSMEIGRI